MFHARGREGERERGREGERERGREGERERGREGERKIGREGEKERGRERERAPGACPQCSGKQGRWQLFTLTGHSRTAHGVPLRILKMH